MRLTFCVACNSKDNLHQHHLVPRVLGGSDSQENLITLCEPCHVKLHDLQQTGLLDARVLSNVGKWLALAEGRNPDGGDNITSQAAAEQAQAFAESIRPHIEDYLQNSSKQNRPTLGKLAAYLNMKGVRNRQDSVTWSTGQVYEIINRLGIDWVGLKRAARLTENAGQLNKNAISAADALRYSTEAFATLAPHISDYRRLLGTVPPATWLAAKLNELQSRKSAADAWTPNRIRTAIARLKAHGMDPFAELPAQPEA